MQAKSVRLFYLVEHEPVDRQTVFLTFVARGGREQLSDIHRTYHLPRPVLALGEQLLSTLAKSGSDDVVKSFPALDRDELGRVHAILRSAPAPRWRVASYLQPFINSVGTTQFPPRIGVRWEISTGGKKSTIVIYSLTGHTQWRMRQLDVSNGPSSARR